MAVTVGTGGRVRKPMGTSGGSTTRKRSYSTSQPVKRKTTISRKPSTPSQPRQQVRRATSAPTRRSTANQNRRSTPRPAPSRPSSSGAVERVTPKPQVPDVSKYLGADEVYQQALRGGRRSLADFLSEIGRRKGESEVQFGQTKEQLEEDRVRQLERMRDEFASRGLIHSGLFGEEQGRFQEAFQNQLQQLEQQQAGLLQDFLSQERDFRREQELAQEVARQEALARRASKYNIPL